MEPINMLRTPTAGERRAITRWYIVTVGTLTFTIISLTAFSWYQYTHMSVTNQEWYLWKEKAAPSAPIVATYTALQQHVTELRNHQAFITQALQQQKKLAHYIRILAEQQGVLTSASLSSDSVELCAECMHTQDAQKVVATLKKSEQFATLRINSLQQAANQAVIVTLHGTLAPQKT